MFLELGQCSVQAPLTLKNVNVQIGISMSKLPVSRIVQTPVSKLRCPRSPNLQAPPQAGSLVTLSYLIEQLFCQQHFSQVYSSVVGFQDFSRYTRRPKALPHVERMFG